MKVLRIVAVLLVVMAGAGGYLYSLQSNGGIGDTNHERTSRTVEESENDSSDAQKNLPTERAGDTQDSTEYESRRAQVIEVFDGDTIKARYEESGKEVIVRVKGIDCPESSRDVEKCWSDDDLIDIPCPEQVPLGKRATEFAKKRLAGETIRLESYDGFKEGDYGRTLAYIRSPEGNDYGLETVKRGLCKDSGVRYDHPRDDQYKSHRRGIKR